MTKKSSATARIKPGRASKPMPKAPRRQRPAEFVGVTIIGSTLQIPKPPTGREWVVTHANISTLATDQPKVILTLEAQLREKRAEPDPYDFDEDAAEGSW